MDYSFSGNGRELKNAFQPAFILADGEIRLEHLPSGPLQRSVAVRRGLVPRSVEGASSLDVVAITLPSSLADAERLVIVATLERFDGDKARMSGVTGLDRTAFGVGQGEWQATDQIPAEVKVSIQLTATR